MKPVFIAYLNTGSLSTASANKFMKECFDHFNAILKDEYHVMVIPVDDQDTRVDIFYEKDLVLKTIDEYDVIKTIALKNFRRILNDE